MDGVARRVPVVGGLCEVFVRRDIDGGGEERVEASPEAVCHGGARSYDEGVVWVTVYVDRRFVRFFYDYMGTG